MIAKVKVKQMSIDQTKKYKIVFYGVDTVNVLNENKIVVDDGQNNYKIVDREIKFANVNQTMFDFISQHSRETFLIEYAVNKKLTNLNSVELIYG